MPPMVWFWVRALAITGSTIAWSFKMNILARYLQDEAGATAIEYGLLAGLIALIIIGAVTSLGQNVQSIFSRLSTGIGDI